MKTTHSFRPRADRIAAKILARPEVASAMSPEAVRAHCDFMTAGALDCVQLNVLASMVISRVSAQPPKFMDDLFGKPN